MAEPDRPATNAAGSFDHDVAPLRIGRVRLEVRDLERMREFYRDIMGLQVVEEAAGRVCLGAGGRIFLELHADRALAPLDRRAAGLFHTAFLLPSRADLGSWLRFAMARRIVLTGAADHTVSEALYLSDPEGNGIEVCADRPQRDWGMVDGQVAMANDRLDLDALMAAAADDDWTGMPEGSRVGHVHLQVGDLAAAENFHQGILGLDVTCRYPGASFFGAGGYHHQLASNIWNSAAAGRHPAAMAGLKSFEIVLRDAERLAAIEVRARAAAVDCTANANGIMLRDPWGIAVELVRAERPRGSA